MSTANQVHIVSIEELSDDVGTECERDTTIVLAPSLYILVGIRPEKIAQEASIGHIGWSHDASNLFHRLKIGRETTVTAENLLVDDGRNGQTIETIGECFP